MINNFNNFLDDENKCAVYQVGKFYQLKNEINKYFDREVYNTEITLKELINKIIPKTIKQSKEDKVEEDIINWRIEEWDKFLIRVRELGYNEDIVVKYSASW